MQNSWRYSHPFQPPTSRPKSIFWGPLANSPIQLWSFSVWSRNSLVLASTWLCCTLAGCSRGMWCRLPSWWSTSTWNSHLRRTRPRPGRAWSGTAGCEQLATPPLLWNTCSNSTHAPCRCRNISGCSSRCTSQISPIVYVSNFLFSMAFRPSQLLRIRLIYWDLTLLPFWFRVVFYQQFSACRLQQRWISPFQPVLLLCRNNTNLIDLLIKVENLISHGSFDLYSNLLGMIMEMKLLVEHQMSFLIIIPGSSCTLCSLWSTPWSCCCQSTDSWQSTRMTPV